MPAKNNSRTKSAPRQPGDRLRKTPQRMTRWVCLDSEAAGRVEDLELKEQQLSRRLSAEPHLREQYDATTAELEDARDEARENSVKFVALSIGSKPWQKLVDAHQPTREQKRDAQKDGVGNLSWNPDSFPRAAILACLRVATTDEDGKDVLSELTADEVDDMIDGTDWNSGEVSELFGACVVANQRVTRISDLGNG